jgi:hypothetical protein
MPDPARPAFRLPLSVLLLPMLAMIVLVFVCPLIWFFARTFMEAGIGTVPAMAGRIIRSEVVVRAIGLTLWTSLRSMAR